MQNRGGTVMQRYELGRLLGQGSFAKVYHAKNIESDQSVAVKVIDKEKVMRVGLAEQIEREISIMRLVRHPNIVRLYEVMATKSKIYFIMEYIRGGELFDRVAKGRLKEEVARKYFQQLINAVDFCHSRGVYHRDLKPENLLLHDDETLKVSDFGLSALVESKREGELLYTTCGTPAYVAPEVIHRKGYNGAKADIWSCGVVLFVLLAGYLPFHDSNLMEMYRRISKPDYKCPNWFPPEARKLISRILDPNPSTRISIEKIKENCWVRKGLYSRQMKSKAESKDKAPLKEEAILIPSEGSSRGAVAKLERGTGLANMNAFDIICLSDGFNLSGLFEDKRYSKVARFLSRQTASTILSKLEDIGRRFKLKAGKKGSGVLRLETLREGRKGVLTIDAEIFELASSFHLVEVKKSSGDTLEYQKILKEDLRPALKDIVFAWQGEHKLEDEQQQQEHELQLT